MLKAIDLFCCAGGATKGLQRAGFHVTGVDIKPRKNYCGDAFIEADALEVPLDGYDFIWASPPCQKFSTTRTLHTNEYPDLIEPTRRRLVDSGIDYTIENVNGAPLLRGAIMLCGTMFGLKVFRHRWFECSRMILVPPHFQHNGTCDSPDTRRVGRGSRFGGRNGFVTVAGNNFNRLAGMAAMNIDWHMTQNECAEAIPPAYSEFIARAFLEQRGSLDHHPSLRKEAK